MSRLTNDIDAIMELLAGGFDGLVTAVLTMVGVGVLLLTMDFKLGAVCLIGFPVLMLLVRWFSRASSLTYRKVRETSALVIVQFIETMTGIRAVQAYRREPRNAEIFSGVAHRYQDANVKSFRLVAIFMPSVRLVGNVTIGIVLLYGGWRVMQGEMTIGVLTAFLLYLRMFFEPMQEISQFYNTFQSASAALEKLSGVLEEDPTVREPEHPVPLPHARGTIRFDGVHFSYVPERTVLPGLDLCVPAGQTVALVGTTGAGKTTIAKLMSRFYDPTDGEVLLDGVDLRQLSDTDLRRAVVMVTQENFMFDGTIGSNIAFGKPGASQAEVEEAARAVGAHEFIAALPEGYGDGRRQARGPAVGRSEAAGRLRPRVPGRPGGADPGRGHVESGRAQRAAGPAGAAHDPGRPDRGDHRPPALDRGDRRPGPRAGARSGDRGRHPGRPGGRRRRSLRLAAPGLAGLAGLRRVSVSSTDEWVRDART